LRGGTPEGITSQFFAIGGGDLPTRETFEVDKMVVQSSGRARPWTLCITAAANDGPDACDSFGVIYGDALSCRTDYLRIIKGEPGGDDFKRKIHRSEVFYFSDGSLSRLMESLRKYDVVSDLKAAYARGAVFAGVGAGAACLAAFGLTDEAHSDPVEGLGLVPFGICTKAEDSVSGDEPAQKASAKFGKSAVVLDYMSTLHVVEHQFEVFASPSARVHVLGGSNPTVYTSNTELQSLAVLSAGKGEKARV